MIKTIQYAQLGRVFLFMLFILFSTDFRPDSLCFSSLPPALAADGDVPDNSFDDMDEHDSGRQISDPLEPVNRLFFHFNDKLYFWALKPVAQAYGKILPQDFRICIRNAFDNALFPARFVNNVLQGKFKNAGIELSRFAINTTAGAAGFGDPAKDVFSLDMKDEDLGQTFGYWGIGNGIYFCWPILGPSTLRDTVGFSGDSYLSPITWVMQGSLADGLALYTGQQVNDTSLVIGDYEAFLESSFDPYVSLRDAYVQHRQSKIDDSKQNNKVY
ncbi:MAG: VacJ family lipoprotein [Deltaproteobacteria bacterium]|nr:VacJ family lipoprotein [Deltaproteobacteria bacterium]